MKRLLVAIVFAATFSACHYGTDEAQKTLKANEQYKTDQAAFSVNRANVSAGETTNAAPADSLSADSSKVK